MTDIPTEKIYSKEETVARREAALKRMLTTPRKPQKLVKHKADKEKPASS